DVAHHSRNNRIARKSSLLMELTRTHQQDSIAVDDTPAVIDEDRAVAVTVECPPHVTTFVHARSCEMLGMGRAASQVDIAAVGLVANHNGSDSKRFEQSRRDGGRGAVRTIDSQQEAVQSGVLSEDRSKVLEVRSSQICSGPRLRLTVPGGPRPVGNDRFHFAFDTIGEFLAPT